jgi:hypothetical protein
MWTAKENEYVEANLRLSNCHDELTKVSSIELPCFWWPSLTRWFWRGIGLN